MKKSILITGATSGIGRAATTEFASQGYQVFATYRADDHRGELAATDNVHPIRMDVTDAADLERAYAAVAEAVGGDGLYAVLNNAGITYSAPFEYLDEKRAREVMEVNVIAPYRITQTFIPLLIAHNKSNHVKARVVNIASWAGLMASPFIAFYNASKFAVIGLTESMFYDLRLLDIHTVLAIPGITKTPLLAKTTGDGSAALDTMPAEGRARYQDLFDHYATMSARSEAMPMLATPEKVAHKLHRIVDKPKPRFKNNLGIDASLIDHVITRLPRAARVAMNRRMYQLDSARPASHAPKDRP
ncbi:SDR family NAD(P)-dependent oxidoreductase [Streptomyces bathyalis]|uniref:SDR family NAD(P)-dependent oxidoreductase n=1 Tax=Streptomyces bathyalis TaxID=2710756 RepID=A0A7T1T2D6_9ACTN|nr:SDR family NAD(P)-dependent oxidoreductase [Streptomyces bathyalis]QPP05143.1 SDR family NAD(P)-dependent oxidoreductase [Streptomyces bathyalis]